MKAEKFLLDSSQTATLLTLHLGDEEKAWIYFLRDCMQDSKNAHAQGLKLLPYAIQPRGTERGIPLYDSRSLAAFIEDFKARNPAVRPGLHPRKYVVDDTPGLAWRTRRAALV